MKRAGRLLVVAAVVLSWAPWLAAGAIAERVDRHLQHAVEDGLQAADFHHLVFACNWRQTFADWDRVEGLLDRLSAVPTDDFLMRDEVRLLRSRVQIESGHDGAARELFRAMGGLEGWWFAGPRILEELADFDRLATVPPDETPWRAVPGTDPLGWVHLAGLAWPPQRQLAYLATTVVSREEQPVAVRVGVAQVARVWINGRRILTTPQPLQRAEDQATAGGWLRQGRNSVVVAVASENRDWWLRARLTRPDGSPIQGVSEVLDRPRIEVAAERAAPEVRDLESEIRAAVAAGTRGSALALAAYLVVRQPQPAAAGGTRTACRSARSDSPGEARLLEWLDTSEPALERELLSDAISAEPDLLWARMMLARWYGQRDLHDEAHTVLAAWTNDEPVIAAASAEVDGALWGPLTLPRMVRVARQYPRCVAANLILAENAEQSRRWDLAREALARLTTLVPGLEAVIELRRRVAESCGDGDELRSIFTTMVEQDPNQPEARIRLARLVAADGDLPAARAVLEDGLDRSPSDIDLMMELARLENVGGDHDRVVKLAQRVLEIRPQEQRAQRLLELLGEVSEDLSWLRSETELWRLADGARPADPAVVVLDHREVHFLPSNLTEQRVQRAYLITGAERAGELESHTIPFVPESERLRILRARVLRRDGSEVSARIGDTPRLAEPEFNLYYDTRLRVLRFGDLEDGDLLEIAYVLSETEEANETGPYNGGLFFLAHQQPMALLEFELAGPADLMPAWELVGLEGEPERTVNADGRVSLRWHWRDLPEVPREVPAAPRLLVTPHFVYSNHPDWSELVDWYARHVQPRIQVSDEVAETARDLVDGVDDRRERIARLYRFVANEIRYVGLEFGEHRFRPFSADWVLHHKIGDCKDKAALLVALCEAVGVPARMVMVRTADQGPIRATTAVLEIFNHAIAFLPEDGLWLDGTAAGHALEPPPAPDQQAVVLVVDGDVSGPQTTAVPGAGRSKLSYTLQSVAGESIEITVRSEDTGDAADVRRARFAGSRDPQRFARWLQEQFPGAQLEGEPTVHVIPSRDPTIVEAKGRVTRAALASGGGIPTFPGELQWQASTIPGGERRGPLMMAAWPDLEWTLEVELGRPPPNLPPPVTLDTRFGALHIEIEQLVSGYRVAGRLHVKPGLVAASDVSQLREFLVTVERHLSRPLESP